MSFFALVATPGHKKWLKQGTFSLLNRIASVLFGFGNLLILVRVLPKAEVGIWILFTSVTAIIETGRNGFIRNPFLAFLSGATPEDEKKIISASYMLHGAAGFFISILVIAGGTLLADFWKVDGLESLFYIYTLTNVAMVFFLQFEYLMQWRINFKGIFLANTLRFGLFTSYLAFYFFSSGQPALSEMAIVQLFCTILGTAVSFTMIDKGAIKGLSVKAGVSKVLSLFHLGKYTVGTNISSMVIKNTDSWMLGRLLTTASVAVYNPAIRIANIVEVPTLAVASLIFPQVSKMNLQKGVAGVRNLYLKSVSLILALILPGVVVIYVFAEEIILLILGEAYLEASVILRITVFYTLLIPFNRQFGTIMDGLRKPKLNFYLLLLVAFLNVAFSYLFIHIHGVIGAAYGTVLAYAIVFVLNQSILYKRYQINTLEVFTMIPNWYVAVFKFFRRRALSLWMPA